MNRHFWPCAWLMSLSLLLLATLQSRAAEPPEAWWTAAKTGDLAKITALLKAGTAVNAKTEYGATALSFAAAKGHLDVVHKLIEAKADVNVRDRFYKVTPLIWATMNGHDQVIKALLDAGANGTTQAFQMAVRQGNVDSVRVLLAATKPKPKALTLTLKSAKLPAIQELLIKAGAEPTKDPSTNANRSADKSKPAIRPTQKPSAEQAPRIAKALNWPQFRGPGARGVADGQQPPTTWDVKQGINLRWKTPIPGLGHSCPVIWGEQIFLTSAVSDGDKAGLRPGLYGDVDSVDDQSPHTWHVYAIDKQTGKILWDVVAAAGKPQVKRHLKGTHANPTPATDGKHLVVSFGSEGLFCYDLAGKLRWKRDLGRLGSGWFYDNAYEWGFASSPIIYRDMAIVQCDIGKGSFVAAYHLEDGGEVWRTEREEIPSWGTPTVIEGPDGAELVTNATKYARGYDPRTGKERWRFGPCSEITVPTPFYAQGLIFVSSGYRPIRPIIAIRPGARGDLSLQEGETSSEAIAWSKQRGGPYLPSPIVYGDYLYSCSNSGQVTCYAAKTGETIYDRERLGGGGAYTGSPVAADGRLYFPSESGEVRVIKAGPEFELLAVNQLGEVCMTTPAISDGMLLIRTEHHLIAVGAER